MGIRGELDAAQRMAALPVRSVINLSAQALHLSGLRGSAEDGALTPEGDVPDRRILIGGMAVGNTPEVTDRKLENAAGALFDNKVIKESLAIRPWPLVELELEPDLVETGLHLRTAIKREAAYRAKEEDAYRDLNMDVQFDKDKPIEARNRASLFEEEADVAVISRGVAEFIFRGRDRHLVHSVNNGGLVVVYADGRNENIYRHDPTRARIVRESRLAAERSHRFQRTAHKASKQT